MPLECVCPVCGTVGVVIPIQILPERGMVIANGKFVTLSGHEMALLELLAKSFPRVLTKESALDHIYQLDPDGEPEIKIIDVYICKIRKKVEPLGLRIDTQWGKGYALAAPLRIAGAA